MLVVKDNIVMVSCNYTPCPDDIASRGEIAVDIEGSVGDAVVNGVLYPRPTDNYYVFDANVPGWVFDLTLAKETRNARLDAEEKQQVLKYFPDTTNCQAIRDLATSYRNALDASTNESELTSVVFDWTIS